MQKTKTWLTETDELEHELDAPDLVIIDASWHMQGEGDARAEYLAEHVPGGESSLLYGIVPVLSAVPGARDRIIKICDIARRVVQHRVRQGSRGCRRACA